MIPAVFMKALPVFAVIFTSIAVGWQTIHLIDWTMQIYHAFGDGSVASLLRSHAYTYVGYVFGDHLGWTLGGV